MLWYRHLYMGAKAGKHRFSIIQSIRKGSPRPGVYVITPPSDEHNVLDIYPSHMINAGGWRKRELKILGIAEGYQEALCLAGAIVGEMYERTGGFCIDEFLTERGGH